MRVPRLHYPATLNTGQSLTLNKELSHYIARVLRLKEGARLTLFNGQGGEYAATLQRLQKTTARVHIDAFIDTQTDSPLSIHLIQGISRGERMQYAIQKAAELGAASLQPAFTARCEVKLDEERAKKRQEHWQSLANSACEQCGRTRLMLILPPKKLSACFTVDTQHSPQHARLVLDPNATTQLCDIQATPTMVSLLIGPEGGLSDSEINHAKEQGFHGLKLGPRILRTETATVVALSVINLTWGDFKP